MSIESALQRVDRYIQKQIDKFEQQKRGRPHPSRAYAGYGQLPRQQHEAYPRPPSHHHQHHHHHHQTLPSTPPLPPRSPMVPIAPPSLPPGWNQEFDVRNQRWHYINLSTGRSQWNPPPHPPHPHPQLPPPPPYPKDKHHGRSTSQPQGQNSTPITTITTTTTTAPPHPSARHSLPPGMHWDMSTGQAVTNMFPPGQDPQSWAHQVRSL